jgi:Fe(3+) dicitrate transport protein
MSHVSEQFADLENNKKASANGFVGEIPSYTIWDFNVGYQISKETRLFGAIRNLLDKKYIASRAPEGIFPGLGRMGEVGVEVSF